MWHLPTIISLNQKHAELAAAGKPTIDTFAENGIVLLDSKRGIVSMRSDSRVIDPTWRSGDPVKYV